MAKIKVEYMGHFGSDLDVVNAARVSFDKESDWQHILIDGDKEIAKRLKQSDADLVEYLATGLRKKERRLIQDQIIGVGIDYNNGNIGPNQAAERASRLIDAIQGIQKHWSPFSHCIARFRISCPIFVARQIHRSGVGFAPPLADDFGYSEESRRYVDDEPEFFEPDSWRARDPDVKQGSGSALEPKHSAAYSLLHDNVLSEAESAYETMIKDGIAPEQARMVLPMSLMTKFIWTGSLYAYSNLCRQRLDQHTQQETRDLAVAISDHMRYHFPVSWKALIRS